MRQNCTKSALIAIWKLINYVYEQKTEGSRPCSATRVYERRRSAVLRFLLHYHYNRYNNLCCYYFQTSFSQLVLWELGAIKRVIGNNTLRLFTCVSRSYFTFTPKAYFWLSGNYHNHKEKYGYKNKIYSRLFILRYSDMWHLVIIERCLTRQ